MKNRLWLLGWSLVVLSLVLSPDIPYIPSESAAELRYEAEALYVPPIRASMQLAPTLAGSAPSLYGDRAAGTEYRAPLVIETPEPAYLALEFGGDYAFALRGTGEPGAEIELITNNMPQSRRVATVDPQGRWEVGAAREDLRIGEVFFAIRYVYDWDSEVVWSSRLPGELPELLLPAYIAEGTRRLIGRALGDVRVEATAEGRTLLALQNRDGSFSVTGIADLAAGSEIVLTAEDALGNVAEAVNMVVRPESALLRFAVDAPQVHRYLPMVAGVISGSEEEIEGEEPEPAFVPTAQSAPEPEEPYFPVEERRDETVDAYATLEGMTLPEIDAGHQDALFSAEVRLRLRDMRRQMVLPVDLSAIGKDGLEIPLVARGYRVGSVWIDPALGVSAETGEETGGFVVSVDLYVGEPRGRGRLQIVSSPEQLDPLTAQGWGPIAPHDDTFHDFDEFVEAAGIVLIYASVPLRFDMSQAEPHIRDTAQLPAWKRLLTIAR